MSEKIDKLINWGELSRQLPMGLLDGKSNTTNLGKLSRNRIYEYYFNEL
jgi:hypothetical protein